MDGDDYKMQQEMFAAFWSIFKIWPGHTDASNPKYPESQRFKALVDAGGYLDAALRLLPAKDWEFSIECYQGELTELHGYEPDSMVYFVKIGDPSLHWEEHSLNPATAFAKVCQRIHSDLRKVSQADEQAA